MNSVTVTVPGSVIGEKDENGTTWYQWSFSVVVNGQAGVFTVWDLSNNPADEPGIEASVIEFLENDPNAEGDLGGVGLNDQGTDISDGPGIDGPGIDGDFIDDDGDVAVASNGGDDSGDSV
jgi:hypothetical protein